MVSLPLNSSTHLIILTSPLETGTSQPGLLVLVEANDLDRVVPRGWVDVTGRVSQGNLVANLVPVIIRTRRGETARPVALGPGESGEDALIEPLSEREMEALQLLAQGLTNKVIAQTLCLSILTVKTHLHHSFGKLGVRSRTEAALWATQHGYGRTE